MVNFRQHIEVVNDGTSSHVILPELLVVIADVCL